MSIPVQKAFLDVYGNASNSLSFGSVCTAGDTIVVVATSAYFNVSSLAIADNKLNAYTLIASYTSPGIYNQIYVWIAQNINAGTQTVTVTCSAGITLMGIGIWELPGKWLLDVSSIGLASGTGPWTLGPITTSNADFCIEALVASAGDGHPFTTTSPWAIETLTPRTDASAFGEQLQSSAGAITATFSGTSTGTYRLMYVGGFSQMPTTGVPNSLMMMGCGS